MTWMSSVINEAEYKAFLPGYVFMLSHKGDYVELKSNGTNELEGKLKTTEQQGRT